MDMAVLTSSDVVDSRFKMAVTEQDVEISFEWLEIAPRFFRSLPIFDHDRLWLDTEDTA